MPWGTQTYLPRHVAHPCRTAIAWLQRAAACYFHYCALQWSHAWSAQRGQLVCMAAATSENPCIILCNLTPSRLTTRVSDQHDVAQISQDFAVLRNVIDCDRLVSQLICKLLRARLVCLHILFHRLNVVSILRRGRQRRCTSCSRHSRAHAVLCDAQRVRNFEPWQVFDINLHAFHSMFMKKSANLVLAVFAGRQNVLLVRGA